MRLFDAQSVFQTLSRRSVGVPGAHSAGGFTGLIGLRGRIRISGVPGAGAARMRGPYDQTAGRARRSPPERPAAAPESRRPGGAVRRPTRPHPREDRSLANV
ncbi:hypothetical protein T261_6245 [Streptomyces lydicus]|nr:hypothetical protein T261_6245 [Streptomyces lydicus]